MSNDQHVDKLITAARDMLDKPLEDKIFYIREDRWLPYPTADRILGKLDALLKMPDKIRPPSMLIVGDSHCGKSSLVRLFRDQNPKTEGMYEAACSVFYLHSCPPIPKEDRLYDEILKELGIPFRYSDAPSKKLDEIKYQFEQMDVKMIILDEISNALGGSASMQRQFVNAIKNLHNTHMRPVVLVGTHEAEFVAAADLQFQSRFKIEALPVWSSGPDFQRFLVRLELTLPFPESSLLADPKMATKIYDRAESGRIGDFVDLVAEAAVLALEKGKDRLSLSDITDCDFVPSINKPKQGERGNK